jgi:hypothetical protein
MVLFSFLWAYIWLYLYLKNILFYFSNVSLAKFLYSPLFKNQYRLWLQKFL